MPLLHVNAHRETIHDVERSVFVGLCRIQLNCECWFNIYQQTKNGTPGALDLVPGSVVRASMLLPETSVVYRSARSARSRLFQPEPLSPLTTRGRGKYRRASWARCCSCLEAPKVDRDHRPAPICQMHLIRVGPYISTIEAFQQVRPYILHITLHRRRSWREKILPPQSFNHRGQMAFRIYIPATRKL